MRQKWGLVVGFLACAGGAACSAVLGGIEPGKLVEAGEDTTTADTSMGADQSITADGEADVRMGSDGKTGEDGKTSDGGIPESGSGLDDVLVFSGDGGCPVSVDPSSGVFVSVGSEDTASCGSRGTPCGTINEGIAQAHGAGKAVVYLSAGTYTETVTLFSGAHVFGGYTPVTWKPICTNANQAVTIQAPPTANTTVTGTNLDEVTQIANLTISSVATADAGDSLYGIFLTDSKVALELDNVIVSVASGGDGGTGATGATGTTGGSDCANGTGASDTTPGGVGAPGAAGSFGETGYTASPGGLGGKGTAGENGVIAAPPTCAYCLTCKDVVVCVSGDGGTSCGKQGGASSPTAGCGGGPGTGGNGGGAGGSSVGLFVWNASIKTVEGAVTAGNGGAGGPGGPGGPGGTGGPGVQGEPGATCITLCDLATCSTTMSSGVGGENGMGGNGSSGGMGGGGPGGSSFAVYAGGGGTVTVSPETTLQFGSAGVGAAGAASGIAKASGP